VNLTKPVIWLTGTALSNNLGALNTIPPTAELLPDEPAHDQVVFETRLRRYWPDLLTGLTGAYPEQAPEMAHRLVAIAAENFKRRPAELRLLDLRRHADPNWFQHPQMLGYATYADLFAGDLRGVAERVDYLAELGVTYLHLLPLLKPRPGQSDGGYAVMDYRAVRDDLGSIDDLRQLATVLRRQGISLTLDLVLNHVAAEHQWAAKARAGDDFYRGFFHLFEDRQLPDAYERSLPEVFPDFAPGSFSYDGEAKAWVWTTFNSWQWDLNWHNPEVFYEFADLICWLANLGVECIRLDAIAFIYKRMGTSCQNQPEVHSITQALRAVARIAAPALIFKAEAIVGPADLLPYLGVGKHAGKVSDLAYQNSLMVQIWSALAAKDTRLFCAAQNRFPAKPSTTTWGTYLRCHDDIGWAVDDGDAASVGVEGWSHRRFLADFYAGLYPMSDARGLIFQENLATGDRRISGTAASLAGIEAALNSGDEQHLDLAVRRFVLAHLIIFGFGGLPLLYMGDELALTNDYDFVDNPDHADDNRWVHRPAMPWAVAERRHLEGTLEHRVWHALRHAVTVRSALPGMEASVETEIMDPVNPGVLVFLRRAPTQTLVGVYNVTPDTQSLPRWVVAVDNTAWDALTEDTPLTDGPLRLAPYQARWLVQQT
jgi:amylosucrase